MTSQHSRPCAGFNVSCGSRKPCTVGCGAHWKNASIAPKPNPAKTVTVTDPKMSREWDVQFTHYAGGIGGILHQDPCCSLISLRKSLLLILQ